MEKLYIIDSIGPFFKGYKKKTINWSKIPFENLEKEGKIDKGKFKKIINEFEKFISKIVSMGYNAISIDDLAHLSNFEFYPDNLQNKIIDYQYQYSKLFRIANQRGIKIFINTDLMFFNKHIKKYTKNNHKKIINLLKNSFDELFYKFHIDGVIFRIGEADGVDVGGDFLSELTLRKASKANKYIKELLPVFENNKKCFIFRTWTFGAYPIGDLIWNEKTFKKVLKDVKSNFFFISMKYGTTDFFSKLKLNRLFLKTDQNIILELQAKREREGFGFHPYYIGWETEKYFQKLGNLPNFAGISVWCQTGGWTKREKSLTFLENSSIWNELNTYSCIEIFKNEKSAEETIYDFFDDKRYVEFLREYKNIFDKILYVAGFSNKEIFFKRTRIPPLVWMFWDNIIIHPYIKVLHNFIGGKKLDLPPQRIRKLYLFGKKLRVENINFHYDTLMLLYLCRKSVDGDKIVGLKNNIWRYEKKYPGFFNFIINDKDEKKYHFTKLMYTLFLRQKKDYRIVDRTILRIFYLPLFKELFKVYRRRFPEFADEISMGPDVIFT